MIFNLVKKLLLIDAKLICYLVLKILNKNEFRIMTNPCNNPGFFLLR